VANLIPQQAIAAADLRHYALPLRIRQPSDTSLARGRDQAFRADAMRADEFADRIGNDFQFHRATMLTVTCDRLQWPPTSREWAARHDGDSFLCWMRMYVFHNASRAFLPGICRLSRTPLPARVQIHHRAP